MKKRKSLYFIKIYRVEPMLWNPAHPEHYNELKKQDAWVRLASLFKSQTEACNNKITSLLVTLEREKQKIKQSSGMDKGR